MNNNQAEKDFHLYESYAFWVSRLAALMQDKFNQALAEFDVTWPQWMVLNVLFTGGSTTPACIAEQIGVDRSAVTRLVDRLEKKHLVEREHDGLDRRSIKIHMSMQGKKLMPAIQQAALKHQSHFLQHLHPTEYRVMQGNLQKMLRAGGIESGSEWRRTQPSPRKP